MPELPEVETVKREMAARILGKTILNATIIRRDLRRRIPPGLEKAVSSKKIENINRRAKYIIVELSGGWALVIHLGMSGRLTWGRPKPRLKHDHAVFLFDDGSEMVFNDARRFGLIDLINSRSFHTHLLFKDLGIEPFNESFNGTFLLKKFKSSKAPVKNLLMDQRLVVGVGNIYASEALYMAGISPKRKGNSIKKAEAAKLITSIRKVLKAAIKSGGSTLRDYVRSDGESGYFQHEFSVYGKAGEPCVRCKKEVKRMVQGSRSTFYCGGCQR